VYRPAVRPAGTILASFGSPHNGQFLGTPEAMQLMRLPGAGLPPSRFRPPVDVTILELTTSGDDFGPPVTIYTSSPAARTRHWRAGAQVISHS
jgi:hypothetical protein